MELGVLCAPLPADPVPTTSEGSPKRTRVKTFRTSYSGRMPLAEETDYVDCSRTLQRARFSPTSSLNRWAVR